MGRGGGYEKTLPSVVPKQENVIYVLSLILFEREMNLIVHSRIIVSWLIIIAFSSSSI